MSLQWSMTILQLNHTSAPMEPLKSTWHHYEIWYIILVILILHVKSTHHYSLHTHHRKCDYSQQQQIRHIRREAVYITILIVSTKTLIALLVTKWQSNVAIHPTHWKSAYNKLHSVVLYIQCMLSMACKDAIQILWKSAEGGMRLYHCTKTECECCSCDVSLIWAALCYSAMTNHHIGEYAFDRA